jgi:hypothetical protein
MRRTVAVAESAMIEPYSTLASSPTTPFVRSPQHGSLSRRYSAISLDWSAEGELALAQAPKVKIGPNQSHANEDEE